MAQKDWKKYILPVYHEPGPPPIAPTFYLSMADVHTFGRFRGKIIGYWHVRGKTAEMQRYLWSGTR